MLTKAAETMLARLLGRETRLSALTVLTGVALWACDSMPCVQTTSKEECSDVLRLMLA